MRRYEARGAHRAASSGGATGPRSSPRPERFLDDDDPAARADRHTARSPPSSAFGLADDDAVPIDAARRPGAAVPGQGRPRRRGRRRQPPRRRLQDRQGRRLQRTRRRRPRRAAAPGSSSPSTRQAARPPPGSPDAASRPSTGSSSDAGGLRPRRLRGRPTAVLDRVRTTLGTIVDGIEPGVFPPTRDDQFRPFVDCRVLRPRRPRRRRAAPGVGAQARPTPALAAVRRPGRGGRAAVSPAVARRHADAARPARPATRIVAPPRRDAVRRGRRRLGQDHGARRPRRRPRHHRHRRRWATIAAITFTEKAAAELRDRVRRRASSEREPALDAGDAEARPLPARARRARRRRHRHAARASPSASSPSTRRGRPAAAVEVLDEVGSAVAFERPLGRASVDELLDDPALERTLLLLLAAGVRLDHARAARRAPSTTTGTSSPSASRRHGPTPPAVGGRRSTALARRRSPRRRRRRDRCCDDDDLLLAAARRRSPAAPARVPRGRATSTTLLELLASDGSGAELRRRNGGKGNWPVATTCGRRTAAQAPRIDAALRDARSAEAAASTGSPSSCAASRSRPRPNGAGAPAELEFHDLLVLARDAAARPEHGAAVRAALHERYQRPAARRVPGHRPDPDRAGRAHRRRRSRRPSGRRRGSELDGRRPAACSSSATPSSRSTGSAGPTSRCSSRPATASAPTAAACRAHHQLPHRRRRSSTGSTTSSATLIRRPATTRRLAVAARLRAARRPCARRRRSGRRSPCSGADAHHDEARAPTSCASARPPTSPPRSRTHRSPRAGRSTTSARRDGARPGSATSRSWSRPARRCPFLEDALDDAGIPYRAESSSLVYGSRGGPRPAAGAAGGRRPDRRAARGDARCARRCSAAATTTCSASGVERGGRWSYMRRQPPDAVPADDPVAAGLAYLRALHERAPVDVAVSELLDRIVARPPGPRARRRPRAGPATCGAGSGS